MKSIKPYKTLQELPAAKENALQVITADGVCFNNIDVHGSFPADHGYRTDEQGSTTLIQSYGCPDCQRMADVNGIGDAWRKMVRLLEIEKAFGEVVEKDAQFRKQIERVVYSMQELGDALRLPSFSPQLNGKGMLIVAKPLEDLVISGEPILSRGRYVDYDPKSDVPTLLGVTVNNRDVTCKVMGAPRVAPAGRARVVLNEVEDLIAYTLNGEVWQLVSRG